MPVIDVQSGDLTTEGVALAEARAFRRLAAQVEACELRALVRYLGSDPTIDDARVLEVAAVFTVSERTARSRLEVAVALTTRLQPTWEALRAGRIDTHKARAIAEATEPLTADQAAEVEARVLPKAPEQAPARLREALRRAVLRVDAEAAEQCRQQKKAQRRVEEYPTEDGAGMLAIHGDALRTQAAYQRIRAIAKKLHADSAADDRTLDQLCSDVALDLLAGKTFDHGQVHVQLTLPASTALGVDDQPGYVAGYGEVTSQAALELAAHQDATWRRILHDPATGDVVDVGRRRYRPPAALADRVRAAVRSCTAPGCVRPAATCDLDHVTPFPHGPTSIDNLEPACRKHHNLKTAGQWTVEQTGPTTYTWTGPSGFQFTYIAEPIADPEPPHQPDNETECPF